MSEALRDAEALVERLRIHNSQLERALESRVVIEQAKGVLAERYGLQVDDAFQLLRRAARSNRLRIHELARRVVDERITPPEIELERARPFGR
jgi:AmiR/NasT family two-component response regulator